MRGLKLPHALFLLDALDMDPHNSGAMLLTTGCYPHQSLRPFAGVGDGRSRSRFRSRSRSQSRSRPPHPGVELEATVEGSMPLLPHVWPSGMLPQHRGWLASYHTIPYHMVFNRFEVFHRRNVTILLMKHVNVMCINL